MAHPPDKMSRADFTRAVDHVIRQRRTSKLLGDPAHGEEVPAASQAAFGEAVRDAVEAAGWAPFHRAASREAHLSGPMQSIVPWRFYVLDKSACCALLETIKARAAALPGSAWAAAMEKKIPRLLAGCGALVLVTWLPDPATAAPDAPDLTERNIEHIAAASAAVQNLLLGAEARDLHTYWSSGGILGDGAVFDLLDIPRNQRLLAAVFLAPADYPHEAQEAGKLRDKRGSSSGWSRAITAADVGRS